MDIKKIRNILNNINNISNISLYNNFNNISISKYTKELSKENYYKAAYILRELLKDTYNFQQIQKLITSPDFFKVYAILNSKSAYNTLYYMNDMIPIEYYKYYRENIEDIKEVRNGIISEMNNNNLLFLFKHTKSNNKNYSEILKLKASDIYLYILDINESVIDISPNILSNMLLFYNTIVKDLIENESENIINLKSATYLKKESANTSVLKLKLSHYIYDDKTVVYESSESIIKRPIIFYESFKTIKSNNLIKKFNTYVFKLILNGYYSQNIFEWFLIFNYYNLSNPLPLLSKIFDIEERKFYLIYNILKKQKKNINKENMKKMETLLNDKNLLLYPHDHTEIINLSEESLKNIFYDNIKLIQIKLNNLISLSDINNYYVLNQISPFDIYNYEYITSYNSKNNICNSKDSENNNIKLIDEDLEILKKIYNTLILINSTEDNIFIIQRNGVNNVNIKEINNLVDFDDELLYYYLIDYMNTWNISSIELLNGEIYKYINDDKYYLQNILNDLCPTSRNHFIKKLNLEEIFI